MAHLAYIPHITSQFIPLSYRQSRSHFTRYIERIPSMHAVHKRISLRIIRCTLAQWQPYHRKLWLLVRIHFQNTSRGSSRPPTLNSAFLTLVSNNAALERSHQNAFDSTLLAWYERGISLYYLKVHLYSCIYFHFNVLMKNNFMSEL